MSLLARDPRVLWRRSADQVVLLTPETDEPLKLSGVGAVVWVMLGEPTSHDELVELLGGQYDLAPDEVAGQLAPFLADLSAGGAIRETP